MPKKSTAKPVTPLSAFKPLSNFTVYHGENGKATHMNRMQDGQFVEQVRVQPAAKAETAQLA